jgi:hypothetical protein
MPESEPADAETPTFQEIPEVTAALASSKKASGKKIRQQRTAYESALAKEEEQELALEQAIQEIHWRHAQEQNQEAADDLEEGEITGNENSVQAQSNTCSAADAHADGTALGFAADEGSGSGHAWHEQWWSHWPGGASHEGDEDGMEAQGHKADASAAWNEWYRQQYLGWYAAHSAQADPAGWPDWTQPAATAGLGCSSAAFWLRSGFDGAAAAGVGSAQGFPPASGWGGEHGADGSVRVPAALLRRYQALEWAEWCRQYEHWQQSYEQWCAWWINHMYHSSVPQAGNNPDSRAET